MVDQVNHWIRPDFVQFIGDNVQNAEEDEFQLFRDLRGRLTVPSHALVGDHDVGEDSSIERFTKHVGEAYGAVSKHGFRFIHLNTLEFAPVGLSSEQLSWFRDEVDRSLAVDERVVVFQHHYPYKVYEEFAGPGIDGWREIVQTRRIKAIFTGHTHYGQIANDGRNVAITTRSIGDPEGGPPGYAIAYLRGDDLALTYRSTEDRGPVALITHPSDLLLATGREHIVTGLDWIHVRVWPIAAIRDVRARLDGGMWFPLRMAGTNDTNEWVHALDGEMLAKGEHQLEVEVVDDDGLKASDEIIFQVDPTGR